MAKKTRIAFRLGLAAMAAGLVLSLACSDDNDDDPAPNTSGSAGQARTVEVTAADYSFKNLPQTLPVGSRLELKNESAVELHEMVVIRLPDSEKRSVGQLIRLPEEEIGEVVAAQPAMVYVAPPKSEGMAVLGDGTLKEAGRYAVICFIPTGADPAAFMAAVAEGGNEPPQVEGGPPHAFQGMFGEITVK